MSSLLISPLPPLMNTVCPTIVLLISLHNITAILAISSGIAYRPIKFYDVGAFVWFAHIIEWEFPGFSVDRCFEHLIKMQEKIEDEGSIEGTIHRYLIVARK